MKTSLAHLPQHIQNELQSITDTIVKLVKPEMVILFGSYSRGNYVEQHRYIENGITYEYKSDYDILVVTKHHQDMPPGFSKDVRRQVKRTEKLQTTPHIIFHDLKFLNRELEMGRFFFVDILREGITLYNPGNHQLAQPRILSAEERKESAQNYFDEWFESAKGFYRQHEHALNDNDLKIAIFDLHQAAERYYMTILLVFTDYKPKIHDLDELDRNVGYEDARFKVVFPRQTDEEKRLFELLKRAYIDSRYVLGYTVKPEDLQWLATRIQLLKQLTEEICTEKIESFGKG